MAHTVTEFVHRRVEGPFKVSEVVAVPGQVLTDAQAAALGLIDAADEPAADEPVEKTAVVEPDKTANLDELKVPQLRERADAAGIDHKGLRKADLVAALREADA